MGRWRRLEVHRRPPAMGLSSVPTPGKWVYRVYNYLERGEWMRASLSQAQLTCSETKTKTKMKKKKNEKRKKRKTAQYSRKKAVAAGRPRGWHGSGLHAGPNWEEDGQMLAVSQCISGSLTASRGVSGRFRPCSYELRVSIMQAVCLRRRRTGSRQPRAMRWSSAT